MRAVGLGAVLLLAGCATVSKERGHDEVARIVEARTGSRSLWAKGTPEDDQIAEWVRERLASGMTRQGAIEIGLVNSPELQDAYAALDVSQADLLQAGLLKNPSFGISWGYPVGNSGGHVETELSLVYGFLDLLVLPLRKRIAERQFAADVQRLAQKAIEVAHRISKLVVAVQCQAQIVELQVAASKASASAALLADRQHRAGNITELARASERAAHEDNALRLAREELELARLREELNRALGLWGTQADWRLAEALPKLPAEEPEAEKIEATALRQRLDVTAARLQAELMDKAVTLAKTSRLTGLVEIGAHVHQDPIGPRLVGPSLTLELPIFDQRQAEIARLEAQQRQARIRLQGLAVDVRSHVRLARLQLLSARKIVERYESVLVPLREKVLEQSQLQYNAMQIGLYELLSAKQAQLEARRGHVEALRDYWVARAELEQVMGGRVAAPSESQKEGQEPHGAHGR